MSSYLSTTPTFDAGEWLTENAAAIRFVMDQVLDVNQLACPTLQILEANARKIEIGPEGKISWNLVHDMYNPRVATPNGRFVASGLDPITAMEFELASWYNAGATNQQEMVRYARRNRSLINLMNQKVQAVHKGLTFYVNYGIFSTHTEDISGSILDIEAALASSPLPPSLQLEDVEEHSQRFMSLPLAARDHVLGHTYGNISSDNAFWQSPETNGYTVTRETDTSLYQCDVVTDATASPASLGISNLRTHLNKMQRGVGYRLYGVCGSELYGVLEDVTMAERQRDAAKDQEFVDLGIDAHFRYNAYNCTFYMDPMMTDLWPNSIFFFDPDCLFFVYDEFFSPWVVDWERIPGTPRYSMALVYEGNLISTDRMGVGAMHGWKA
jgi:hypothetical protein